MKKFIILTMVCLFIHCDKKDVPHTNILFIHVDDLTYKYLGYNGAEFARTPNIDKLARSGVIFKNAMVQGTMCIPSRNSMITNKYPHELGLYENLDIGQLPENSISFPSYLKDLGYTNFWIGKNHLIPGRDDIKAKNVIDSKVIALQRKMGFDTVYQSYGRSQVLHLVRRQMESSGQWEKGKDSYGDFLFDNGLLETFVKEGGLINTSLDPDEAYMDGHFTTRAIEKLEEHSANRPFFMWLNFSGPHGPFNVPKEFLTGLKLRNMPDIIDVESENFDMPSELKSTPNETYGDDAIPGYRRRYIASIAYIDAQIGRLMRFLLSSPYKDNTVVFFFSDHGIMTGDHGLLGKNTLYKEVLNASLIISCPGMYDHQIVETPVELMDLGKTALNIANAPQELIDSIENGHSLLPLLTGEHGYTGKGLAFSETRNYKSVFDGTYKYIHHEESPILFNLKEDPDETENWLDKNPEKAEELRLSVLEWLNK